jgi:NAD(P)-dependent dehydrogenase (short-subunit alcohol dehydrogenase family)
MEGRVVLVTGSTDGIGKQTALELARLGASVVVHGRNPTRTQAAVDDLRAASRSQRISGVFGDLSSLQEVRALADAVKQNHPDLNVLINNAGVYTREHRVSTDGFELTFAVNYLAVFLLTNLLTDLLAANARPQARSRIVNVASMVHQSGTPEFDSLQRVKNFDGYAAYADSKLALVMYTYALARRLESQSVTVNALHPGVIDTKLLHAGFTVKGHSPETGAETPVYLASSPEVETVTGRYFAQKAALPSSPDSYDEPAQNDLWQRSEAWIAGH